MPELERSSLRGGPMSLSSKLLLILKHKPEWAGQGLLDSWSLYTHSISSTLELRKSRSPFCLCQAQLHVKIPLLVKTKIPGHQLLPQAPHPGSEPSKMTIRSQVSRMAWSTFPGTISRGLGPFLNGPSIHACKGLLATQRCAQNFNMTMVMTRLLFKEEETPRGNFKLLEVTSLTSPIFITVSKVPWRAAGFSPLSGLEH